MTSVNHPKLTKRVKNSKDPGSQVLPVGFPSSHGPTEARGHRDESAGSDSARVRPGNMFDRRPMRWLGPTTWVISSSEDLSPMPLKSSFDLKVLSNKELRIAIDLGILGPELIQTIEKPQLDETLKLEPDFSSLKGLVRKLQASA